MLLHHPRKTQFAGYLLLLALLFFQPVSGQENKKQPGQPDSLPGGLHSEALRIYTESVHFSGREWLLKNRDLTGNTPAGINQGAPGIAGAPAIHSSMKRQLFQKRPANIQRAMQIATCKDSSYQKLSWTDNGQFYLNGSTLKLKDGSILASGSIWDRTQDWQYFGLLVKYDSLGNVLWAKKLKGSINFEMPIKRVVELSDGSLAIAGYYNSVAQQNDTWVAKLTGTGDIIWAKKFRTSLTTCNPAGYLDIRSMAEGISGELLVAGTTVYCPTGVAFRLDASGNMVWSTALKHRSNQSWADGIYFVNNEVVVMGRSGSPYEWDLVTNMTFLRFNYQTGALMGEHARIQRGTVYLTNFWTQFAGYEIGTARLDNGHFIMAGKVFDANIPRTTETYYFSVIEFDRDYNYVAGYLIGTPVTDNITSYDHISIGQSGKINFAVHQQVTATSKDIYMGAIQDGQFQKQRKVTYNDAVLPWGASFISFGDGSDAHLQIYYASIEAKAYVEFVKMHNSDTSGNALCMGLDTNFARLTSLDYVPYTNGWSGFPTNQFYEVANDIYAEDLVFQSRDGCVQQSWCDTLKVHGPDTLCSGQQTIVLTAYKNRECGAWVNWQLPDTSAISKVNFLNDTTVSLQITSNWEGKIYAAIDGRCAAQADSIKITVLISPDKIDLGKDTSLCPSNTLKLNARKGFFTYRWQDGSTDSTYLVQQPGKYYVTATNACGTLYTDTIEVKAAPPIPFDLGPEKSKCNKDSITISAPAGFLNYSWSPSYNVLSTKNQQLVAFPGIDTMYHVAAEKTPGCFAYDSIRIKVNTSPVISLGKDTSFCFGDSLVLNAGAGFQSYSWSTGASSQTIVARNAGIFIVNAKAPNNCPSSDTLQILKVYANPVSQLNKDAFLCTATTRILTPGNNFDRYLWQDGTTQSQITISTTGKYWVKFTDANHCSSSDTVWIKQILPVPTGFLPADTMLCTYASMTIIPASSFKKYTWSTGATATTLAIKTSGLYWLLATDQFGCIGSDTIKILPKECLKGVFIPSAFSPNRDGKNDLFKPILQGPVIRYELTIFNRWGQQIFFTQDRNTGWDGTINGRMQDTGGYTWTCTWQLANEPIQVNKGVVTLVR
jgi:gliding motility-associated-like protein